MIFSVRTVREEDAESIVELLNPIIEAGKYTIITARKHAFVRGEYLDEILMEKLIE